MGLRVVTVVVMVETAVMEGSVAVEMVEEVKVGVERALVNGAVVTQGQVKVAAGRALVREAGPLVGAWAARAATGVSMVHRVEVVVLEAQRAGGRWDCHQRTIEGMNARAVQYQLH